MCGIPTGVKGVCVDCSKDTYFTRGWCVGERTQELRRLIDDYKFERVQAAYKPLASLISQRIGALPSLVTIVPIPTASSHVRQRGYDHTLLLAKELARYQNVSIRPILKRVSHSVQRGASRRQRFLQAKTAFAATKPLDGGIFLLIDDIITTGATLRFAAKALLENGADEVWVAIIARQPIDDTKDN